MRLEEAVVRPVLGTVYLYRRIPGDEFSITLDKETIFFDSKQVPTDLEAYITPDDFNLSIDFVARNLPLLPEELKEEIREKLLHELPPVSVLEQDQLPKGSQDFENLYNQSVMDTA